MSFEELTAFEIAGLPVYRYGLFIAAGALLMCLVALLCTAKSERSTVLSACVCALPFALVFSRLFYFFFTGTVLWTEVLSLARGGFSMIGALLGVAIGVIIACRLSHKKVLPIMDEMVTGVPLFLVCARVAEFFIDDFGITK